MSVVGIDLGAQSTKVGVARNKGIDIVRISISFSPILPLYSFFPLLSCLALAENHVIILSQSETNQYLSTMNRSPTKFPTDLPRKLAPVHYSVRSAQ